MIDPRAVVDPKAELADDVTVGPFCVIGPDVQIGSGTIIGSHTTIDGPTRIGSDNRIYQHAAIGGDPQDKKFHGESNSQLIIGDNNTIREFTTLNRGTDDGGGVTKIGNDNWIMAYVHVAHDCIVGDHTIMANNAALAGHVVVEDWVILGGYSLLHQFCRIGAHAFTSMGSAINRDVPPFVMVAGQMAEPRGINSEGLRRRGFDAERIAAIRRAYRGLYMKGLRLELALTELDELASESADVKHMIDFIKASERSIVR